MKRSHLNVLTILLVVGLVASLTGCMTTGGNVGTMATFTAPSQEAAWIKDGQPIIFEEELWHPQDRVDILLDSEVDLLGQYMDVQFFVEKRDVRPYNRLYTKFDRNKFRVFEKKAAE